MRFVLGLTLIIHLVVASSAHADWVELYDALMQNTFKIEGPSSKPNRIVYGTVFLMGRPYLDDQGSKGRAVMVSAAHVFERIAGNEATVYFRRKESKNHYLRIPTTVMIRRGRTPLWIKHPNADVAAMYVSVPEFVARQSEEVPAPSTSMLATDETFELYQIHPGEELLCLGYPHGVESNKMGFSILRSGKIASFPLIPAKEVKSFLFDFEVFGGNSGGPVFLMDSQRRYGKNIKNEAIQFIVGLVSEEKYAATRIVKPLENTRPKISVLRGMAKTLTGCRVRSR